MPTDFNIPGLCSSPGQGGDVRGPDTSRLTGQEDTSSLSFVQCASVSGKEARASRASQVTG